MPLYSASAGLKESKPRDALREDANHPSEKAPRESTLPSTECPQCYPCHAPHGAGATVPSLSPQCHDFQPRVHRSCAVCYSIFRNYFVLKPVDGCICCCFAVGWFVLLLKFALNTPAAAGAPAGGHAWQRGLGRPCDPTRPTRAESRSPRPPSPSSLPLAAVGGERGRHGWGGHFAAVRGGRAGGGRGRAGPGPRGR